MTEIEELKKKLEEMEKTNKENLEVNQIKKRMSQLNHPKTVKFANFMGKFGRGLGTVIKGTPKAIGKAAQKLNEMDEKLAREQAEQRKKQGKKGVEQKPMSFQDAANILP